MKPCRKPKHNPQSTILEEQFNQDAARNGREAEALLTKYIQNHEDTTAWIVEEIGLHPYAKTGARHRAGLEKPDVVLHLTDEEKEYAFISLKCCKNFATAFNQIKRCSLDKFQDEFGVDEEVIAVLKKYTAKKKKLLPENYSAKELNCLLKFLNRMQQALLSSAFAGQDNRPKANWLLLHQWTPPNWRLNIGKKTSSSLVSMTKILTKLQGVEVTYSKRGTITFGAGVTLQRKGGDNGKKSANDLQFKLRIKQLLEAL